MTYKYRNLQFNESADPAANTHTVMVEGVRTEQLGMVVGGRGSEGALTAVWGQTAAGEDVTFYISEDQRPVVQTGGVYRFTLSDNRQEPRDYREPDAPRRVFGVCRAAPVPQVV